MSEPHRTRPRVVLLGASNVTLGISTVLGTALRLVGGPASVLAALGHGRSYGTGSTVLGRTLPGIVGCGLWDALAAAPPAPTYVLVTDIGNDIAYGQAPETVATWLGACLERLQRTGGRMVITQLPLASLETLGPWRFAVARRLLFPGRPIDLETALARARRLAQLVADLAAGAGATLVEPPGRWYGLDPVHIRRRQVRAAWPEILRHWTDGPPPPPPPAAPSRWLALRTATPERWWLLDRPRGRPQPCRRLRDGSTVALY